MNDSYTPTAKVRLVRLPPAPLVDGHDLRDIRSRIVGQTYDVPRDLARYLVAAGYAEYERASIDQAADQRRKSDDR